MKSELSYMVDCGKMKKACVAGQVGVCGSGKLWSIYPIRYLLIVRPHPDNFNGLDIFQNLINQPVLNIEPSGKCA